MSERASCKLQTGGIDEFLFWHTRQLTLSEVLICPSSCMCVSRRIQQGVCGFEAVRRLAINSVF